jgi:hypothetical protein
MLETEHFYYKQNRARFYSKYPGKTIVIVGNSVVGVYESHQQAYDETIKQYRVGTFLIKSLVKRVNPFQ